MSNTAVIFLSLAVAFLAASFIFRHNEMIDGLGKALFGVFLSLFFIVRFFGARGKGTTE